MALVVGVMTTTAAPGIVRFWASMTPPAMDLVKVFLMVLLPPWGGEHGLRRASVAEAAPGYGAGDAARSPVRRVAGPRRARSRSYVILQPN